MENGPMTPVLAIDLAATFWPSIIRFHWPNLLRFGWPNDERFRQEKMKELYEVSIAPAIYTGEIYILKN